MSQPRQTVTGLRSGSSAAEIGTLPGDVDRFGPPFSASHLVVIPSFQSGDLLMGTVAAARRFWAPVWIVIDGSTDGSGAVVDAMARTDPALRVLRLPVNSGKGAAVACALIEGQARGFTHALVMDADGQHPAERIPPFMAASLAAPDAVVVGRPVFGPDAPWVRVVARRLCNWCAALETMRNVGDTLFGFRVYPVAPLLAAMRASRGMRRFDFDPEAIVRLAWQGLRLIQLPAPVRYLTAAQGGVSHFRYLRDNMLLTRMHGRLVLAALDLVVRRYARRTCRQRRPPPPRQASWSPGSTRRPTGHGDARQESGAATAKNDEQARSPAASES